MSYFEIEVRIRDVRFGLTLPVLGDPRAEDARKVAITGIVRVLGSDEVYGLLTAETDKARAFVGGLAEVVAQMRRPDAWLRPVEDVIASILREAGRRGYAEMYGRQGSMSGAVVG